MKRKTDLFIAVIMLALSMAGYLFTGFAFAGEEKTVIIEVHGKEFARYPMTETRIVDVDGHNTVEITPEYVRVIYADCPDKLDVKQGKITSPGSILICMPNQMTVRIAGESKVDAISY